MFTYDCEPVDLAEAEVNGVSICSPRGHIIPRLSKTKLVAETGDIEYAQGKVYIHPRHGVTEAHLRLLAGAAVRARRLGPTRREGWRKANGVWRTTIEATLLDLGLPLADAG